jgi:hypothetical protein
MADLIIFSAWSVAWGAFALWACAAGRRDAGETPRRCRGVQLWTGKGATNGDI